MRAAIIGAAVDDRAELTRLVRSSTRMTHTDPRAESGALAVAVAAQMARQSEVVPGADFLDRLRSYRDEADDELVSLIEVVVRADDEGRSTADLAASLGLDKGVSGFVCHTVPVAIHAWLTHQRDFPSAVRAIIQCGSDPDSTGAIVGGIVGASVGREGIPDEWLDRLIEWPRSVAWMERLAVQLDATIRSGVRTRPIRLPVYGVVPRNLFFLMVVLLHGARRALPPYG
jgi:ADP-ribosylglycohydrolase